MMVMVAMMVEDERKKKKDQERRRDEDEVNQKDGKREVPTRGHVGRALDIPWLVRLSSVRHAVYIQGDHPTCILWSRK